VPIREELARIATHDLAAITGLGDGAEVRVVALVGEVKGLVTKQGRRMAVVTLEDLTGRIEATIFPDVFDASQSSLVVDEIVVVAGRVESRDDRGLKLLASDVTPWEKAHAATRPTLHLEVRAEELSQEWLERVDEILSSHPGQCDVYLHIVMPDRSRQGSRSRRYRVAEGDPVLRALVGALPSVRVRWSKGAP